jgi:hypothetical protein
MEPNSKIILTDLKDTGFWSLAPEENAPKQISKVSSARWYYSRPVSPNGQWIAHPSWNDDSSASISILSLITGEQREVAKIKSMDGLAPYVLWLSDQELLVVNHCHTTLCHFPLGVVNINTGQYQDFEADGSNGSFLIFFKDEHGNNQALFIEDHYGDQYARFLVYDYSRAQETSVFPWLEQKIYPYLFSNINLEFSGTKTAMIVDQTYGFDFAILENSLAAFTRPDAYDVAMTKVFLGFDPNYSFDQSSATLVGLDTATNSLFLEISTEYLDSENEKATPVAVDGDFFRMDYKNFGEYNELSFTDYCFSTADNYFSGVSPDGTIAVFQSNTVTNTKNEITLMNLKTGYLTRLPGWKFIGWQPAGN